MKKRLFFAAATATAIALASSHLVGARDGSITSSWAQILGKTNIFRAIVHLIEPTAASECCQTPDNATSVIFSILGTPTTMLGVLKRKRDSREDSASDPRLVLAKEFNLARVPRASEPLSEQPPLARSSAAEAESTSPPPPKATFRLASDDSRRSAKREVGGLTIMQIGDSHTAADFFTGEVRRYLQARYGSGGPGYVDVGRPHLGVRSAALNVSATPGWSYSALQKSTELDDFYLSGFTAKTSRSGEVLSFSSDKPIPYDLVEVEAVTGPKSGSVDISFDGGEPIRRNLATPQQERIVYRFLPDGIALNELRRLSITTSDGQPVAISGLSIFNKSSGVSYSNIGFPGATVDILNKFDPKLLKDEIKRLAPQIIVLSFGTNEGFNDNLDLANYREHYRTVIRKIRSILPQVTLVMIGPAQAERVPSRCINDAASVRCAQHAKGEDGCAWPVPPNLDRVRAVQRNLAREEAISFWDWANVMPAKCGADTWSLANPRLMTGDHVHFTSEGYRTSASRFVEFLNPIVSQLQSKRYAFSDH